jgi:ankyrin repeat protein
MSPLHCAAYTGKLKKFKLLLDNGANVNVLSDTCGHKDNLLNLLITKNVCWKHWPENVSLLDFIKLLIKHKIDMNYGAPLVECIRHKWSPDILKYLIKNGSDVNQISKFFETPLHMASYDGYYIRRNSYIDILLEHGANINLHSENTEFVPLLFWLINNMHHMTRLPEDTFYYLVEKGAADITQSFNGKTLIECAKSKDCCKNIVLFLHSRLCKSNPSEEKTLIK